MQFQQAAEPATTKQSQADEAEVKPISAKQPPSKIDPQAKHHYVGLAFWVEEYGKGTLGGASEVATESDDGTEGAGWGIRSKVNAIPV